MAKKITKDEYYLGIAKAVSAKSNCLSVAFGCVIVRDDQIISTGYVGSPRKTKECAEIGHCMRRKYNIESGKNYEFCRSVHAEMNAIINAARAGVSLLHGDMYLFGHRYEDERFKLLKAYPCLICKRMIINAGIKRFIGNNEEGGIEVYDIDDWVKDWQEIEDFNFDKEKYQVNYKK